MTADLTLFAGWAINSYTVTFDTGAGSAVAAQAIEHGALATPPEDPTRPGHVFTGWYLDAETTIAVDFALPVTHDLRMYAGWEETEESGAPPGDTADDDEVATPGPASADELPVTGGELSAAPLVAALVLTTLGLALSARGVRHRRRS